jgi:RNA polymerase sigma factor (sigma-70 family)
MHDPALAALMDARDDADADAQLSALLVTRVQPLVRTIAARKLAIYGGFSTADVEDVAGEALLVLVGRLREVRRAPDAAAIANLDAYAATVTYHACAHAIRQRHPQRARLKARVRYVLTRDPAFGLWDEPGGGAVCGLAAWEPRLASPEAHAALDAPSPTQRAFLERQARAADSPAGLTALVRTLVQMADGPIELDRLVGAVARVCGIVDAPPVAEAAEPAAPIEPPEAAIDARRFTARLWAEVGQLPLRQRVALLLHLRDARGAGVLWLLPLVGIATIRQVARLLDITDLDMAGLWGRLPLDDHAIADRLGCTRQQVINLRMSARKRLATRLRGSRPDLRARRSGSGNLAVVPPSMDAET